MRFIIPFTETFFLYVILIRFYCFRGKSEESRSRYTASWKGDVFSCGYLCNGDESWFCCWRKEMKTSDSYRKSCTDCCLDRTLQVHPSFYFRSVMLTAYGLYGAFPRSLSAAPGESDGVWQHYLFRGAVNTSFVSAHFETGHKTQTSPARHDDWDSKWQQKIKSRYAFTQRQALVLWRCAY